MLISRGVTGYIKKLNEFLSSPEGSKVSDEDFKIKKIALRSTENIQVAICSLSLMMADILNGILRSEASMP